MTDRQLWELDAAKQQELWELYRREEYRAIRRPLQAKANRHLVSAKLYPWLYKTLYAYAKANDLSLQRAIIQLLENNFKTQ